MLNVNNNLPKLNVLASNNHHGINGNDLKSPIAIQLAIDDVHFRIDEEISLRYYKYQDINSTTSNENDSGILTPNYNIARQDIRNTITLSISNFPIPEKLTKLLVYYVLSSASASIPENSPGTDVYIKASRPGGEKGEGLHAPQLPAEIVNEKNTLSNSQRSAGVDVIIPAYTNMSVHDRISLLWGNQYLPVREVTADEVGKDILIHVPPKIITDAGLGDIQVHYHIMDYVENKSFEPDPSVSVHVGEDGTTRFKPVFLDAEADIVDLRKVVGDTVRVKVPPEALAKAMGKVVELSGTGYTKPLNDPAREIVLEAAYHSVPGKKVDADAILNGVIFEVPKALLRKNSVVAYDARYMLADDPQSTSLPASVGVTGKDAVGTLPPPVVDGLEADAEVPVLNIDAHPTTTVHVKYPDMKQGDLISLFWRDPAGHDAPISVIQSVTGDQKEMIFSNIKTDTWTSTAVILYYSVQRTSTVERSSVTTFTTKHASVADRQKGRIMGWGTPYDYDLIDHEGVLMVPTDILFDDDFTMISGRGKSHLAIEKGSLVGWGLNNYGQLGCGDTATTKTKRHSVIIGAPGTKFKFISTGDWHSLAIDQDNNLWAAGWQGSGLLGNGITNGTQNVFMRVPTVVKFLYVDAGGSVEFDQRASIGISTDHKLYTWGQNIYGVLGNGQDENHVVSSPTQIRTDKSDWIFATINYYNAAAIDLEGGLYFWGRNIWSQLTTQFPKDSTIAVPTLVNIVDPTTGLQVKWSQVAMANRVVLAIDKLGRLWTWGQNCYGLVGYGQVDQYYPPQVHPSLIAGQPWKDISASDLACSAIDARNMLWTWGWDEQGQMGRGPKIGIWNSPTILPMTPAWTQVIAAHRHMIGLYSV